MLISLTVISKNKYMIKETMLAARQYKAGGPIKLEQINIPEPRRGEVLIRMDSSPINPSDLSFISGKYGSPGRFPVTPGFEGSGTVVAHGGGILPGLRHGKRVACSPKPGSDGTWAEYIVTSAAQCVPLPRNIDAELGSMLLINPMSVHCMLDMSLKGKHRAIVNTAASSSLGKMLIRLVHSRNIPMINVVRSEKTQRDLRYLGAAHVLNSSEPDFQEKLSELIKELKATIFFDAVGGMTASQIIEAAPENGCIVHYANLSEDLVNYNPRTILRKNISLEGFQLGNYLNRKSLFYKMKLTIRVRKFMQSFKDIQIHSRFPLSKINEATNIYRNEMGSGKVLISMKTDMN
jgi:NADPH:quinone reductase-like Zn-dependent oxidoreductase